MAEPNKNFVEFSSANKSQLRELHYTVFFVEEHLPSLPLEKFFVEINLELNTKNNQLF